MKKIISAIFIICIFATGFRGGCIFGPSLTGNNAFYALVTGLSYNKGDGFIDLYYIAAGADGKIYTTDSPVSGTWTERNSGINSNINYLRNTERTDTAVTFGVGDDGKIIRSLDQGATWVVLNSAVTENLKSIDFIGFDLNTLVAVGESGLIIKSTNGGNSWAAVSSGVTKNLNSIYSTNSFSTIIAGDDGTLLRSSNSGANWMNQSLTDSLTDLNKIGLMGTWFFGNIYGMVGDNGRLYRSTNLLSWDSIPTGTNADLYDIKFKNASSGYVCGDSGTIAYTTNGGVNWYTDIFLQTITNERISSTLIINDTVAAGAAGNNIFITHANESLLPVELTSFTSVINKNNVTLRWTTESELNNSGFFVERSQAQQEWISLEFINGNGTSSEQNDYEFTDKNLNSGKYTYRLKQTDYNGNFEYYNLTNEIIIGQPEKFGLYQNYPNPFNPVTKLAFELPLESDISLVIYDMTGRVMETVIDTKLAAGYYEYEWNASSYSSGIYFYKISSGYFTDVKKMMLVK